MLQLLMMLLALLPCGCLATVREEAGRRKTVPMLWTSHPCRTPQWPSRHSGSGTVEVARSQQALSLRFAQRFRRVAAAGRRGTLCRVETQSLPEMAPRGLSGGLSVDVGQSPLTWGTIVHRSACADELARIMDHGHEPAFDAAVHSAVSDFGTRRAAVGVCPECSNHTVNASDIARRFNAIAAAGVSEGEYFIFDSNRATWPHGPHAPMVPVAQVPLWWNAVRKWKAAAKTDDAAETFHLDNAFVSITFGDVQLARDVPGSPPVGHTGGLHVVERSGATFSSSDLIQRMAFQRSNVSRDDPCGLSGCTSTKMAFQLSSAGGFALRDWGFGGEYATQAHLVAEKLASLGGAEDLDYLRQELLKESVTNGVCHVSGTQWHLGYQGAWEVNAEWILSVHSYIAHSGDASYTDRVPERLVCVENTPGSKPVLATATRKDLASGESICATPVDVLKDYYSANGVEGVAGLYVEHMFPPSNIMPPERKLDNAGKRLGQWVSFQQPFAAVWLPISAWGVSPVQGLALWPFNLTLTNAVGVDVATMSVSDIDAIAPRKPSPILSNWLRLAPKNGKILPAGLYLVKMTAISLQNRTENNGFWNGAGWLTDAIPSRATAPTANAATTGAVSATYNLEQLQSRELPPLTPVRLRTKLRQAMNWSLSRMKRRNGSFGTFVIEDARFCGSNHSVLDNKTWPSGRCWPGCSYYDTLRMGYKSSYWALLYLQAMKAYLSLQQINAVDILITPKMVTAVAADISNQFVDQETGDVAAWISCDLPPNADMTSACDPTRVLRQQQTRVAYDFMPSLALAVKLGIEPKSILARKLATMRKSAQVYGTTWQLNGLPLEGVSPRFWWPTDRSEPAVDVDGYALRSLQAPVNSDWQMFRQGDGIGNWGLNAQNGGNALGTSSFVLQAGSYPEVYRDYKKTVKAFESVLRELEATKDTAALTASLLRGVPEAEAACRSPATPAGCLLRRPLKPPGGVVQQLCQRVRLAFGQQMERDRRNTTNCDWYPNVELALPENAAWLGDFGVAVLGLSLSDPLGSLSVYGTPVEVGGPSVVVKLDVATAASLPLEVDRLTVVDLNVFGKSVNVSCRFGQRELNCSAVTAVTSHSPPGPALSE